MSMLTRRTQILLDEDRYARLVEAAKASRRSVASVIRDAIDDKLADDERARERREAGEWLLGLPSTEGEPEPDWSVAKREMLDGWGDAPLDPPLP